MKLRHLTLAAGFLGAVITNHALAVGLGEITLNSALNEPLDAEIQLLNVGELTELEMLAGLGSQTDFDTAGVDRLFLLTDLRFEINLSDKGNPVIQVSSKRPIREPYLDFLVELDWPAGRLLREYTLLLDMPLYATEKPVAKKIEAASSGAQPTATPTAEPSTPAPRTTVSPALAISDDEYRVASGDTVWAIATKIRPQGATMSQTMAAIKQANPDAFINGNINLLKKGAVLRLPEGSDIQALSAADSAAELAIAESASEAAQAPMLDATSSTQGSDTAEDSGEGRLKLAALGADQALSSASAGEEAVEGSEGTSVSGGADLTVAREELDKATRENAELRERIAMLEEQLSTNERLLEIQDDSMRASQVATLVEPEGVEPESEVADQATAPEVTAETVAEKPDTTVSEEVAVKAEPVKQDKGFDISAWMDYLLYPAIGLVALLLAVLMLFRNRKQDDEATDELSLQTLVDKDEPLALDEVEDEEALLSDSDKEYIAELAEDLDEEGLQDLEDIEELDELQLEDGEGVDPKGEADIYLSLGNYTQAENILKGAIEQDPQDTALRLKLLEVYVNANDPDAFAEQYQQLLALDDPAAQAKAAVLRAELVPEDDFKEIDSDSDELDTVSELPEVAEFSAPEEQDSDFVEPSLDFDLGDVSPDAIPEALEESEAQPAVELEVEPELELPEEFDLGAEALEEEILSERSLEDTLEVGLDETPEAVEETVDADFDLDLDLEDVDLDSLSSEIDEEMPDVELEAEPEAPVVAAEDNFVAPDALEEQTLEELEDSILSGADEGEDTQNLNEELKAFGDEDECDTKLVLAETYMDMGDSENARDLLNEVIAEGNEEQIQKARNLLETVT